MIAVFEFNGKQYRAEQQQVIRALRVAGAKGDRVETTQVLAVINGDDVRIGQPLVEGAKVALEIVRQVRSPKLNVFTYQARKRVSRRRGYREDISYLRVAEIEA